MHPWPPDFVLQLLVAVVCSAAASVTMDALQYRGQLSGHRGWVTSIATTYEQSNLVVSCSRDKKLMIWELTADPDVPGAVGYARRLLSGHSQPASCVVLSSDGSFALSSSWDKTMRLWDLNTGATVRTFQGHEKDVNSVAFSGDNRQIVSGSRDKSIKLWNTLGECKYTISEDSHTDWVSCVVFSPSAKMPLIVSGGWDKLVKVWNLSTCKLRTNLVGHTSVVYTCTVSPDGSLCASGGKDGSAMLWDVNDGKSLYCLDAGGTINALTFSPKNYWLCAATDTSIKIFPAEKADHGQLPVAELAMFVFEPSLVYVKRVPRHCKCMACCTMSRGGVVLKDLIVLMATIGTKRTIQFVDWSPHQLQARRP